MRWFLVVFAVAAIAAACTENLTTPGQCPALCPGGQSVFRDTVLSPIPNGDSSFIGYVESTNLLSMLVSNGGTYGQARAVIRFSPRGDSIEVSDTNRAFNLDSVVIELGLQALDTTTTNIFFDIYRLPLRVDSTISLAGLDSLMTPATLIGEYNAAQTMHSGNFDIHLTGPDLARVAFADSDSTTLEIGVRIRGDGQTAARLGTAAAGALEPSFTTWVTAPSEADTTLQVGQLARVPDKAFTVRMAGPPPAPDLLAVGGDPVARTFFRFQLPPYLKDSATIIRATLELTASAPVFGIPADTATINAFPVIVDFGAKSPVLGSSVATATLLPGATTVALEIAPLVNSWQGATPLPQIVRLSLGQEGGTFIAPLFRSSRSTTGQPILRITYRPPFAFQGF